jgi:putative membrane protein
MKFSFLSLLAACLLLGTAGCGSKPDAVQEAQQTNEAKIDSTALGNSGQDAAIKDDKEYDSKFMTKAASGGILEVALGKEVAQRATTPEAKQAAQMMVTDHTKANDALKALAARKNITLPASLGDDQKKVFDDVLAKKGADLDKEYVKEMVKDHQEDIKEFTDASAKAGDPEIKALAAKTVPVLQMHLAMFEKLQTAMDAKK